MGAAILGCEQEPSQRTGPFEPKMRMVDSNTGSLTCSGQYRASKIARRCCIGCRRHNLGTTGPVSMTFWISLRAHA